MKDVKRSLSSFAPIQPFVMSQMADTGTGTSLRLMKASTSAPGVFSDRTTYLKLYTSNALTLSTGFLAAALRGSAEFSGGGPVLK